MPSSDSTLHVRVQPRAGRDEIVEWRGEVLVVRVTAPPAEGRANRALCKLLARRLRVAPSRVDVVRGTGARDKVVRVEGVSREELRRVLGA